MTNFSDFHHQRHQAIAFIDAELLTTQNSQYSLVNLTSEVELIAIDSHRDGIKQITAILSEFNDIDSLQLISSFNDHEDSLKLGSTQLNIHTLKAYQNDLQQWQHALTDASEILIYGCRVLAESIFQNFIYQLATITGADIGAFVSFPEELIEDPEVDDDPLLSSPPGNYHLLNPENYSSLMVAWRS